MSASDHFGQRQVQQAMIDEETGIHEEVLDWDDLYDSEKIKVREVYRALQDGTMQHREMGAFQREVRERFAEIGIVARCDFYERGDERHLEGVQVPSITLIRRCEPTKVGDFDHEQMGHEVRSNILGVKGQENVQKTQVAPGWSKSGSGLIVPGS